MDLYRSHSYYFSLVRNDSNSMGLLCLFCALFIYLFFWVIGKIKQNMRFNFVTNAIIHDITSKDSKYFHVNVLGCRNITFQHFTISAPENSPNTDGIHIGRSKGVTITDSKIQTGDDCISIGDGSQQVTVTKVTCGPGHGFSIGSLGKYPNEEPVVGITFRTCTLTNTMNGVRIKSWPGAKSTSGVASDMHFEDIIMNNVGNPVLIDQKYCPWNRCDLKVRTSKNALLYIML